MVTNLIAYTRIVAILPVAFALISCGTVSVQKYPADWPPLVAMSATCADVSGTYIDTNSWRWEYIDPQNGSKYNGTLEAAWSVFTFKAATVRPRDPKVKSRAFSIAFGEDSSLAINYLLEDKVVSARSFSKGQWSCGKEGINMMTLEKTGVVMDKWYSKKELGSGLEI